MSSGDRVGTVSGTVSFDRTCSRKSGPLSVARPCRRRWPPILCLELCPLPSVARLLTIAWPTRETNPAGEWLTCVACVDATRRVAPLTKLGAASVTRWSCSSTMRARPPSWTTSSCRLARHERSVPTRLFVRKPKKKSDAQPSRSDALYGVFRTGRLKISARGAARLLGLSDQLTQNEVEER